MPSGGDPVKLLGPYVLKACVVVVGIAVLALVGCGAIIGKAF